MMFERATLKDCWDEALPLMKLHFGETGSMNENEFSPDKSKYFSIEALGNLRLFTARVKEELVGYCIFMMISHLHYQNFFWAIQDVLYMKKKYRGINSVKFIRWVDFELKEDGANVICRLVSPLCDYSRTLKRMGYECVEYGYMRRV